MKQVILTVMILGSLVFSANAQTQEPPIHFKTNDVQTLKGVDVTGRVSDGFDFYTYKIDTSLDETTVKSLQFYLDGDVTVTKISNDANKKIAVEGMLVSNTTQFNVKYFTGTMGKVMMINSKLDSTTKIFQKDTGDVTVLTVRKTPRIILVSFSTNKKKDIWLPFSAGPNAVSGDEQFTTSHAISESGYAFSIDGETYRVRGTGTLKFFDADNHHVRTKTVHGRRWNE